jgi:uncharacterized alpha-E superfamily protein
MDWIDLAQDRDRWLAVVTAKMLGISGLAEDLLVSQEGFCFMKQGRCVLGSAG